MIAAVLALSSIICALQANHIEVTIMMHQLDAQESRFRGFLNCMNGCETNSSCIAFRWFPVYNVCLHHSEPIDLSRRKQEIRGMKRGDSCPFNFLTAPPDFAAETEPATIPPTTTPQPVSTTHREVYEGPLTGELLRLEGIFRDSNPARHFFCADEACIKKYEDEGAKRTGTDDLGRVINEQYIGEVRARCPNGQDKLVRLSFNYDEQNKTHIHTFQNGTDFAGYVATGPDCGAQIEIFKWLGTSGQSRGDVHYEVWAGKILNNSKYIEDKDAQHFWTWP